MTDREIDASWRDKSDCEERGSAAQHASLARIEMRLENRENYTASENIANLSECIRNLAKGSIYQIRERIEIFDNVQNALVSIPGHAEYFDNRIREAYEPLKGPDPGAAINGAQNEMMYGFETLKNLPSPETVKVLGGMLSETWRMKRLPPLPGDVRYTPPSLALAAVAGAFIQMPLREPPLVPAVMAWEDPEVVMVGPWQNWWEEVKTGKRTFSFKGQSMEYRFNPDGTWQTLAMVNPPDDGPKPEPSMPSAASPEKNPPPSPKSPSPLASERAASPSTSGWIIGCGILVLAVLAIFLKRRHAS